MRRAIRRFRIVRKVNIKWSDSIIFDVTLLTDIVADILRHIIIIVNDYTQCQSLMNVTAIVLSCITQHDVTQTFWSKLFIQLCKMVRGPATVLRWSGCGLAACSLVLDVRVVLERYTSVQNYHRIYNEFRPRFSRTLEIFFVCVGVQSSLRVGGSLGCSCTQCLSIIAPRVCNSLYCLFDPEFEPPRLFLSYSISEFFLIKLW